MQGPTFDFRSRLGPDRAEIERESRFRPSHILRSRERALGSGFQMGNGLRGQSPGAFRKRKVGRQNVGSGGSERPAPAGNLTMEAASLRMGRIGRHSKA